MKNLEKREVRSHNKVSALFTENSVRFARAEQLWWDQSGRWGRIYGWKYFKFSAWKETAKSDGRLSFSRMDLNEISGPNKNSTLLSELLFLPYA